MIYGITHHDNGAPIERITIGGKVSIGLPPDEKSNFPKRLDHFYFAAKSGRGEWTQDGPLTTMLQDKYGKRDDKGSVAPVREFDIVLLSDDIETVFRTELAWWTKSERKCSGNGREGSRRFTALTAAQQKGVTTDWTPWKPCGDGCPEYESGTCKPSGNLYFMLADRPVVGVATFFHTSGFEGVKRMVSSLAAISSLTGGRLKGIRLKMVLRPYKARYMEGTTVKTSVQYAANVEFRQEDYGTLVPRLIEQALSYETSLAKALPTGKIVEVEPLEEGEEAATVGTEFYPTPEQIEAQRAAEACAANGQSMTAQRPTAMDRIKQQAGTASAPAADKTLQDMATAHASDIEKVSQAAENGTVFGSAAKPKDGDLI